MTDFSTRLQRACDDSQYVPSYNNGRQTVIAKRLGVSQEAVRKYFAGGKPGPKNMKKLAEFLNVEESWLALGIKNKIEPNVIKELKNVAKGAIHALAGMIHFEGGNSAFPVNDDADNPVDIFAITKGRHVALHVSVARALEHSEYELIVPRRYNEVQVVAVVVHKSEITWLHIPKAVIETFKKPDSGDFVLTATQVGNNFEIEGIKLNKFKMIGEIL